MMQDSTTYGAQLQELLKLNLPPVGIAFRPTPPSHVRRIETPSPAGCAYWRLAAEGEVSLCQCVCPSPSMCVPQCVCVCLALLV